MTTVCDGPAGALTVPMLVTDESIAGTTTTSRISCPATAYVLPPAARPGQRWGVTCSLASPAEKVVMAGQELGPATIAVGRHTMSVDHTRLVLTFDGTDHGTNPTDFWIVPSSGLIVRERESVAMSQGGVRYNEDMVATLSRIDPTR